MSNESKLVRITGLFKQKSKSGDIYYQVKLGSSHWIILQNKNKRADRQDPDLFLCVAPPNKKEDKDPFEEEEELFEDDES